MNKYVIVRYSSDGTKEVHEVDKNNADRVEALVKGEKSIVTFYDIKKDFVSVNIYRGDQLVVSSTDPRVNGK